MKAIIKKSKAKGKVKAPPSKSMAHRLLLASALSGKGARVKNIAFSKDIEATLGALSALGVEYSLDGDEITFFSGFKPQRGAVIDCNESGSTLRFMIPIALTLGEEITFTGSERLFSRPLSVYEDLCRENGCKYEKTGNRITVQGNLPSGDYILPGDISSQFITGLMFALSLTEKESRIILSTELKSEPYVMMTVSVLQKIGIEITKDENVFVITPKKPLKGDFSVEGDWSNAAFLEVFNLLGGEVELLGVEEDSLQGDKVYREYFEKIKAGNCTLSIDNCPDLGPILISLSALLSGATLIGTNRLKIKESDRGNAMREELLKLGVEITVGDDFITIPKGEFKPPKEPLQGHNDHRIVMSLVPILATQGGEIEGVEAVSKSFPDYFQRIKSLGIEVDMV